MSPIDDELRAARVKQNKSLDTEQRAASGASAGRVVRLSTPPGASGNKPSIPQGTEMKTIAEQIASFEANLASRPASSSRSSGFSLSAAFNRSAK